MPAVSVSASIDIRKIEITEVVRISDWLDKYIRLENPALTDSELLLDVLVRSTREYEGDFGVFEQS
ncbi:MAG: hypothetical protein Q8922_13580 [Bacteroidota bacterium]|nr:hypothetical protein [Bacteroidota bacterium]MDP4233684.1 hypothetical protein [Bacteroidota bacterium]MDP4241859.1 hypothetical protein [Bacteroidota bacterium]MDP4288953.1 hypothetical protein [Bacteroidota bacterium]